MIHGEPFTLGTARGAHSARAWAAAALALAGCGGLPAPPPLMPVPAPPPVEGVTLQEWPKTQLVPPRPIAPTVRWEPPYPVDGTLVAMLVEPAPNGLPLFEVRAHTSDVKIHLVPLAGGRYLGLVGAPIAALSIPVEIDVTFMDGTRLTRSWAVSISTRQFPSTTLSVARQFTAPDRRTLRRIQRERRLVRTMLRTVSEEPLWRGPFILPRADVTTSPFGQRRLFNNQLRSRHTGLDIDGETGDPIYAANSGRVALARGLFFNGNAVFIDHGLGLYTGYFHMSRIEVAEGEWVEKWDVIGRVGATGRVTGPHLHWGLYYLGLALDPISLLLPEFTRASELLQGSSPAVP